MEDVLSFERGYNPDIDVFKLPKGSYMDSLGFMRDESGNLISEPGTSNIVELPQGYKIMGHTIVGDDIVLASTDGVNSELGVLDIEDQYVPIVNNTILGFTKENRVQMESKIDYKGDRIIYIAGKGIKLRAVNLDDIPASEFDKDTSLFLEYDLPVSNLSTVASGGNVLSGVYQFATRLLTGSENATAFGPLSEIIPIVTGEIAEGRKNVDGAEPQTITSKAINITIKNIDPAFEYIEPCVITYKGNANVVDIKSLGKREINGRSEITFTYSGEGDESDTILEEELNLDNVYYDSAEYITQKDNTLDIAGVTEIEDTYDWQSVANTIVLKHVIKKLPYEEEVIMQRNGDTNWDALSDNNKRSNAGGDSWSDIGTSSSFEDYKNPEIAAKYRGYRRGETYSFTFTPIFKGGRRGNAYHIPALNSNEILALGATTDNALGISPTADHTYPEGFGDLTNQVVRYHRMPNNVQEPSYTEEQGQQYVNALGITAEIFASGWEEGLDGYIIGRENRAGKETVTAQGFSKDIFPVGNNEYTFTQSFGNYKIEKTNSSNITDTSVLNKRVFTYHSPDILTNPNLSYIPSKIERICKYTANIKFADTGRRNRISSHSFVMCNPGEYVSDVNNLVEGYSTIETRSFSPTDNVRDAPINSNLTLNLFGLKVDYKRVMECIALKTDSDLPRYREFIEFFSDYNDDNTAKYQLLTLDDFEIDLYNLIIDRPNFYGDVYDKVSEAVSTVLFNVEYEDLVSRGVLPNNKTTFFNGDTFISRYAVVLKNTGPFYGGSGETQQDIPKSQSLVYLMVESNNNYNYRHYDESTTGGTLPYYPKYRLLKQENTGILDTVSALGSAVLYNKQYSAENALRPTFSKILGEDTITKFENRIPYSATSIEGEKFDAYRLFLPANYHDIPKQYGKITGLFVQGNDLMVHTERCLWRTFFNALVTQVTSAGDIVLGNGGAFNRPSVPIVTSEGGYAGCKDISASVSTPAGRYFYDAYRSKMFYLADGLKEVSNPATFKKLRELAYGQDAVLGYDFGRKRVIASTESITLSYRPELNSFDGRHPYTFYDFISRDINDYIIKDNKVEVFSDENVGRYFGEVKQAKLTIPSIVSPMLSKRYVSAYVILTSTNSLTKLNEPFKFFSGFKAYTRERNTGFNTLNVVRDYLEDLEVLGTVNVHKANNKFRLDIPQDIVDNIELDIHAVNNLKTSSVFTDLERMYLPDMIDDHIVLEFTADNATRSIIKVTAIIANFEQNKD